MSIFLFVDIDIYTNKSIAASYISLYSLYSLYSLCNSHLLYLAPPTRTRHPSPISGAVITVAAKKKPQ